jgi:hypothetical protein
MRRLTKIFFRLFVTSVVLASSLASYAASDVKVEDVINGNLDSIAKPDVRSKGQSRVVEGTAHFAILTGGAGTQDGKAVIVSEGRKVQLNLKFPNSNYRGEKFITDGNKVMIGTSTDNQSRSSFGQLVYLEDAMMREGLLGGTLSTAWALLDWNERKAKVTYEGLKNIDGRSLHDVRYKPKKNTDVEVHLFFDPETFRHVLTVYTLSIQARMVQGAGQPGTLAVPELGSASRDGSPVGIQGAVSGDAAQAGGQAQTRYRIEERFSDFKTADGLTLPTQYVIHYTQEPQGGKTTILDWDVTTSRILQNVTLDPKNFEIR